MEVITNTFLNKKFKSIPEYKIDLGFAINVDEGKSGKDFSSGKNFKIKDKTVKKYYESKGRYLNKIGKIGTLSFYVDNKIKDNEIYIINEDNIFKSGFDNKENIRIFLSNLIVNILENKIEPYETLGEVKEEVIDLKKMSSEQLAKYLRQSR